MSVHTEFQGALEVLERIQLKLRSANDIIAENDLNSLIYLLDSPLLSQLLSIEDSLQQLKQVHTVHQLGPDDFDFSASSGELIIHEHLATVEEWDSAAPTSSMESVTAQTVVPPLGEAAKVVELAAAQGRTIEHVTLYKAENTSLGFSVVGLQSEQQGEIGIFVQEIQPGGIAASDGRLQENDQILAIDNHALDANISHQQAIRILQKASGQVELVVARGSVVTAPSVPLTVPPAITTNHTISATKPSEHSAGSTLDRTPSHASEGSDMVLSTEWSQIEVIDLLNDGSGLGFGIIGGKSTGVVVKTILPGGVADKDGRLLSGDHLLQIGDVNVRGMGSEQVASVLRQSGALVRLIVARPVNEPTPNVHSHAQVVPTYQLDEHLHNINQTLSMMDGMNEYNMGVSSDYFAQIHSPPQELPLPEVEFFEVELVKDTQGLGITIAGYVGERTSEELSGIFVRCISEGSAAALDGRIQVNDQIIEVDSHLLEGFNNHQAVEVLRNTGQVVRLKLARYNHGAKFQQLQQYAMQQTMSASVTLKSSVGSDQQVTTLDDVKLNAEDFSGDLDLDIEQSLKERWQVIVGDEYEIVVAQLSKFREGGGLGISLEGTVDVENGQEVRPHHYIRSVLIEGPVGANGRLKSSDELLEVNNTKLLGLNHVEVVMILKELPQHVRIVCARKKPPPSTAYVPPSDTFFQTPAAASTQAIALSASDRLVKAKSEQALSVTTNVALENSLNKLKSRSLEPLSGLAMWSSEPVVIALEKGDRGLGFSILDYQDPINPAETVIVIRSLVPGGVAQMDGRLVPGDRLVFVNDTNVENATLEEAVQALKGALKGSVRIGVAKPLPLPEIGESSTDDLDDTTLETKAQPPTVLPPPPDISPPHTPPPAPPRGMDDSVEPEVEIGFSATTLQQLSANEMELESEELGDAESTDGTATAASDQAAVEREAVTFDQMLLNEDDTHASVSLETFTADRPSELSRTHESSVVEAAETSLYKQCGLSVESDGFSSPSAEKSGAIQLAVPKKLPPASANKPKLPPKPKLGDVSKLSSKTQKSSPVDSRVQPAIFTSPSAIVQSQSASQSTSSDLTSFASTPVFTPQPPVTSPNAGVTRVSPGYATDSIPPLPSALERTIKIKKGSDQLGLTVETTDKGVNGCVVKTLSLNGAVAKDGRIVVGDYILTVNNESMRRITNAQARAILRRASLLGTDISITYIPAMDAAVHLESAMIALSAQEPPEAKNQLSPNSTLLQPGSDQSSGQSAYGLQGGRSASDTVPDQTDQAMVDTNGPASVSGGKTATLDSWGQPRLVEIHRQDGENLGISIVGGRMSVSGEGHMVIAGIFIKHVLESSPAGRNGTLKTGDRILEVDGVDLRDATHDKAVEVIRKATSPVHFLVQSLLEPDWSCNGASSTQVEGGETDSEEEDEYGYTWKKVIKMYGDLSGELHLVQFERSSNGLGLSLAGNKDLSRMSVYIVGIQQDSPVARDGRIRVGDELLEINGHVLFGRSHLNASAIIKSVTTSTIKIILLRREDWSDHMAVKPLNLPPVQHKDDPDTLLTAERLEAPSEQDVLEQKEVEDEPKNVSPDSLPSSPVNNSTNTNVTRDIRTVMLQKTSRGLGIEVRDNSSDGRPGIFVKALTPKGAAALCGQLSVGDQLLAIGDQTLEGVPLSKALELLKQSQGSIQLTIEKVVDTSADNKQANGQYNSTHPMSRERLAKDSNAACPKSQSAGDVEQQEDPATCAIIPGREIVIQIEKGKSGLGLSIVGGADTLLGAIIIHEVYEEGAAAKDGRLWAGDQILEVNGEDLRDASHERAIQVLRETPSTVCMLVFRDESVLRDEDIYDVFAVDLMKKPGRGLGISIVGRRNDTGIFISDIVKGGVADSDGRLVQGDQILSVNGEDMRDVSQEHAAAVLKTLIGKVSLTVGRLKTGSRTSLSSRHNSSNSGHSDHSGRKSDLGSHGKHKTRHSKGGSEDNGWGGRVRVVELERDSRGSLGISIAGGVGSPLGDMKLIVASLQPGGAAELSGKLLVGDQILSINGQSTEGLTHSQAVEHLKSIEGAIRLEVIQGEPLLVNRSVDTWPAVQGEDVIDYSDEGDAPQIKRITLERGVDGLGFSIVGGYGSPHGDLPIYVKTVFAKGAASENGILKRGDQIMSVNNETLEGATHEQAVQILKRAKGTIELIVLS